MQTAILFITLLILLFIRVFEKKNRVKNAVVVLTKAIKEDEGFYIGYKSNIAMSFYDEVLKRKDSKMRINRKTLHEISNQAAINFIDLWSRK